MEESDKKAAPLAPIDDMEMTNRERYFNYIKTNLDDYAAVTFTAEEKIKVEKHLRKLSTGASAMIPLYCAGPACPFASRCVYQQMGKAPIGKACLIEVQLLQHWTITYMEEYQVDPDSFTEVGYCNELSEIEVMLYRLNMLLSRPENADGTIDQTMAIGNDGTPVIQKIISPWMEQKEKLLNRRSRVIKLMVGDRQEKYKKEAALKIRESKDPSSRMADVRRQIELLQRNLTTIEKDGIASAQKALLPAGTEDNDVVFTPEKTDKIKELEAILTPDQLIGNE